MLDNPLVGPLVGSLVGTAPALIAWVVAIALASGMMRRGGGRAERLLLAGCIIMLVNTLVAVPVTAAVPFLVQSGASRVDIARAISYFGLFRGLIALSGIVLLVYAFWTRFNAANR